MRLLYKYLILSFLNLLFLGLLFGQDESMPDILRQKPLGKELSVKLTREDCNYIYYQMQKGAPESKLEWSKVLEIRYGEESQNLSIGLDQMTGNTPNFVGALSSFERVIADKNLSKWQIDMAIFHAGLCHLGLGNLDKAKEKLLSIKNDSRWFYKAKLKMIDTLADDAKVPAIKELLKGSEVTGPFKIELSFMLVDRYVADGKGNDAKMAFDELKKIANTTDRLVAIQLDEYQIKIDVMNKNFGEAEKKILNYVGAGTETGIMRIALGDVYLSKGDKTAAYYEYLRGRLDFEGIDGEAGFKAGKLFSEVWQDDKAANADFRRYAIKELNLSFSAGDGVWSLKAKKLLDQLTR